MLRRIVVLLVVAAVVYWFIRDQPTVAGFVDRITSPLFGTKAVVEESEHNRIVSEAAPVVSGEADAGLVAALREGMKNSEVRDLLGDPDEKENLVQDGKQRVRWTYRRIHRSLYFEENRVVSVVVVR